jgi:hypothetical protein
MTTQQHDVVDFIVRNKLENETILVMIEDREWGDEGQLLPDLRAKLNGYCSYISGGKFARDYPALANGPVKFQLQCVHSPGERELAFLEGMRSRLLEERGIGMTWELLGE